MHSFDRDFDRDFDRHFERTQKNIKNIGCVAALLALAQILFYLAIGAGIVYFIVFTVTHWLRW